MKAHERLSKLVHDKTHGSDHLKEFFSSHCALERGMSAYCGLRVANHKLGYDVDDVKSH